MENKITKEKNHNSFTPSVKPEYNYKIKTYDSTQDFDSYHSPKKPTVSNKTMSMNISNKPEFGASKISNDLNAKPFKSQYLNDSGKWTLKAVDDNFVDFDDYINDIQNDTEEYISFNNKPLKINYNPDSEPTVDDKKTTKDYTLYSYENTNQQDTKYLSFDPFGKIKEVAIQVKEAADETQKEAQRKVWRFGAQHYLREQKGFETSAWMLEHALQDNPSDIVRGNDSRIAYLINNDENYLSALDKAIAQSKDGTIDTDLENVRFEKGDLYYSINKAKIHVTGYKQDNGKWLIYAELDDEYDFTEIQSHMGENGEFSFDVGLGTVANDAAVISQKLGAVNPYHVKVQFYTTR